MIFKMKFRRLAGAHVHCRLFGASRPNVTYAKIGDMIVRTAEFDAMRAAMAGVVFEEEIVNTLEAG